MGKKIFLHIGTHKTGSTSIQEFLVQSRDALKAKDIAVYTGLHGKPNHVDIYLAAQRYERDSFQKEKMPDVFDEDYSRRVASHFAEFFDKTEESQIAISAEGLSLLIYEDEIDRLKRLLGHENEISILLFLRNKADFLRSYRAQVLRKKGRMLSSDPRSALYVEADSWLADYDRIVAAYERGFPGCLKVADYDACMRAEATVIPEYLRFLGLQSKDFPDIDRFFYNQNKP